MSTTPKYDVDVQLSGRDGNAFAVLGAVRQAMRRADVPNDEIEAFTNEAMSGDYDHLLRTAMAYVRVS
jgi:hypothetical protein